MKVIDPALVPKLSSDDARALRTSELIASYVNLVMSLGIAEASGNDQQGPEIQQLCASILVLRDEIDRRLPQAAP